MKIKDMTTEEIEDEIYEVEDRLNSLQVELEERGIAY